MKRDLEPVKAGILVPAEALGASSPVSPMLQLLGQVAAAIARTMAEEVDYMSRAAVFIDNLR